MDFPIRVLAQSFEQEFSKTARTARDENKPFRIIHAIRFTILCMATLVTWVTVFANTVHATADANLASAAALFFGVMTLSCAFSIPIAPYLAVAAGWIFGLPLGMALVVASATFGGVTAVAILRSVFKKTVTRILSRSPQALNYQKRIESDGIWYVFLARLLVFIPYVLVNALVSGSRISLRGFAGATLIGMVPWSGFYCYLGTQIRSFEEAGFRLPWQGVAGLAAMAGILALLRRIKP